MSYDFMLVNSDNQEEEYWSANYTYNVSPMLRLAFSETGTPDWRLLEGQKASAVRPHLARALGHMIANPETYEVLNPPNGWGSYDRLVVFLTEMWKQMYQYPAAIFQIS